MANRVVINNGSVAAFLAGDLVMQKLLETAAVKIEEQAKANAPWGVSVHRNKFKGIHGYYKRRFSVVKYRNGFRVWNKDPFAHLVEWGSVNNVAYSPIRRAVHASNLRYVPNPQSRGA